jgi:hypothetical protein
VVNKVLAVSVVVVMVAIIRFESMFGGRSNGGGRRSAQYKGQDFNPELHLDLKDVTPHKRTFNH